eukprot:6489338-Amphidinium_carterae.1
MKSEKISPERMSVMNPGNWAVTIKGQAKLLPLPKKHEAGKERVRVCPTFWSDGSMPEWGREEYYSDNFDIMHTTLLKRKTAMLLEFVTQDHLCCAAAWFEVFVMLAMAITLMVCSSEVNSLPCTPSPTWILPTLHQCLTMQTRNCFDPTSSTIPIKSFTQITHPRKKTMTTIFPSKPKFGRIKYFFNKFGQNHALCS